ncbi:metallophosphoesterase [Glacieibacterium frigidum]|uniref:Metallophosphoesterase n=1 Tax=Glacieibacterium frigidum TaxID=2593303 RepID=A0A552UI81_9SPHN|nr:metallophosphoesterase [Glacieibacterium frigidum]TRW17935.1 metallophosphoesterase [Glacieibacterium frigidum]
MRGRLGILALLLAGLALAVVVIGYAQAVSEPRVVRYRVALADWPADAPPLRIVQMSDIHVAWPDMPATRLERIVAQVNALRPDIVVLTGDYQGGKIWDVHADRYDAAVAPLARLRARYGVYAVRGNHDGPRWTPFVFARTPITLLQNRWVAVGPITLAGMDDVTGPGEPYRRTRATVADAPAGRPIVLLAHEPDFFKWVPPSVDLVIAGHTHGGQIEVPLLRTHPYLDPYLETHRRGLFVERGQQLIVSSGIGTSVLPLRIGVPPEIVEITLGPA